MPTAGDRADCSPATCAEEAAADRPLDGMSAPSIKKLSLTPQRSAIPPISGGIMIEVSR